MRRHWYADRSYAWGTLENPVFWYTAENFFGVTPRHGMTTPRIHYDCEDYMLDKRRDFNFEL